MRERLRSHLTYANVISTLCLFLVLGGGSAVALSGANTVFSDDIVDNEVKTTDVRNDTLSGGGLAAADLKPSSVGTSEVAANSLNGGDINESGLGIVPKADKLDGLDSTGFLSSGSVKKLMYQEPALPGASPIAIATVGPYTIKARCEDLGGFNTGLALIANGAGPVGSAVGASDYMHLEWTNNGDAYTHRSGHVGITANTDTEIIAPTLVAGGGGTEVKRTAGTVMLATGLTVVQVDFNGVADSAGQCYLRGTATMGT